MRGELRTKRAAVALGSSPRERSKAKASRSSVSGLAVADKTRSGRDAMTNKGRVVPAINRRTARWLSGSDLERQARAARTARLPSPW
jgi:hypothetical protein